MALISDPGGGSNDWTAAIAKLAKIGSTLPFTVPTPVASTTPGAAVPSTVPPPPTPSTPGSGPGHWQIPDYNALLAADPLNQAAIANEAAQEATAGKTRAAAIQQALINFGLVPQGFNSSYGDVNADVLKNAAANPFSTTKQLALQRSQGNADLDAALAARGILASGALTGGEQSIQTAYDSALSNATQQLLQALGGYETGYANTIGDLKSALIGSQGQAAQRIQEANPAVWIIDPVSGKPVPVPGTGGSGGGEPPPPVLPPASIPSPVPDVVPGGLGGLHNATVYTPPTALPPFNPAALLPPPPKVLPTSLHSFVGI
jgi:hypothetical protein